MAKKSANTAAANTTPAANVRPGINSITGKPFNYPAVSERVYDIGGKKYTKTRIHGCELKQLDFAMDHDTAMIELIAFTQSEFIALKESQDYTKLRVKHVPYCFKIYPGVESPVKGTVKSITLDEQNPMANIQIEVAVDDGTAKMVEVRKGQVVVVNEGDAVDVGTILSEKNPAYKMFEDPNRLWDYFITLEAQKYEFNALTTQSAIDAKTAFFSPEYKEYTLVDRFAVYWAKFAPYKLKDCPMYTKEAFFQKLEEASAEIYKNEPIPVPTEMTLEKYIEAEPMNLPEMIDLLDNFTDDQKKQVKEAVEQIDAISLEQEKKREEERLGK